MNVLPIALETRRAGQTYAADPAFTMASEGVRLMLHYAPAQAVTLTGLRLKFRLTFPAGAPLRVHHHTLPRLHRQMTLPDGQKLGDEGLPRTRFSSPGNDDLPAGHQDMALHNAFVAFQPGGPSWLLAPLSEDRSQADSAQDLTMPDLPPGATLTHVFTGETATPPLTRTVAANDAELWHCK